MRLLTKMKMEGRRRRGNRTRVVPLFAAVAMILLPAFSLRAQVGNDNPTGPSGVFNGNVATAGSYDPYTGNAKRSVTDIVVAGSVGSYPLAFTRTANSRFQSEDQYQFGGTWRHNFNWSLSSYPALGTDYPQWYWVAFPDGRIETFASTSADTLFRAGPGIPERFIPLDLATMLAYLILPDGGKVEFAATAHFSWYSHRWNDYSWQATAIIDPYGLRTTLTYNGDGSLNTIQEPAGRWIQLVYGTVPWLNSFRSHDIVIDHVQASNGQVVQYNYNGTNYGLGGNLHTYLENVAYPADSGSPAPTAHYTYQAPNVPDYDGQYNAPPLLATCDDPMYGGPMRKISYTYATGQNPDGTWAVSGQIQSENYFDGINVGVAVSTLTITGESTRTETRGDGPSRTFTYSGGKLTNYTDFRGYSSAISYDGNGYIGSFTDARLHMTTTLREDTIGAVSVLTHPDPEQSNRRFIYKEVDGGRYFLQIAGDERDFNSNTYFTRDDVTNRVTKIWYPDYPNGPTEEFTYTGFGKIETHTMTSRGVANFRYDGRGLMYLSWPPPTPSDPNPEQHPTRYFYYTSGPQMDRLWYVVDPRGYSTRFEYNVRGQTTKVTHDQDGTFAQYGYNIDGTLAWTADENHPNASWNVNERTRYIYDDYKRVVSVTNPMNETTSFSYAPPNGTGSYAHTTSSVYRATSQLNKITAFDYDQDFRKKMVRRGAESTDDDGGSWFGYDEVGNLTSVQDPRGNITTFEYDERNRRKSATNPVPFNNQVTRWEYDTRSNLTKEIRPDLLFRRLEYDSMSRVIDTYGFANEHIHYERDLAGNIRQLVDPKPAAYSFDYDTLNRKIGATYPLDANNAQRSESWHYDWNSNLDGYTNPAGKFKHMFYDGRNRNYYSFWDGQVWSTPDRSVGPEVNIGYDNANRMTSISTNGGETTVTLGYDDVNRQTWEEQTVAGFPTRRVETPRDNDGLRASLNALGAYTLSYDYTKRGQLANIYGGGSAPWFSYAYDRVGNMLKRQDVLGSVNDSTNVIDSNGVSQYDPLNRPMQWEQTATVDGIHNSVFARSHFAYDNLSRLTASWRDEQAGKGEWFGYHATGQLTDVAYNADNVSNGTPQNATRIVNYAMTADTLNRSTMTDNPNEPGTGAELSIYTRNALNQYTDLNGGGLYYDGNFNLMWTGGFSAGYDSENNLTAIGSGEDYGQFVYDGLGRCVKRTIDWETTLITYDGWQPIVEWDEWNNLKAWNVYGSGADEILYRHDGVRGDLRYHLDQIGNVVFILDSDGDGIERYTYDAFGHPTVTDWNGDNPRTWSVYGNRFMFTGREYFAELGLYDYRDRFYYPVLGRFLQSDPTGFDAGDANLFRYCGGDPVNGSDPMGLGDPAGLNDIPWAEDLDGHRYDTHVSFDLRYREATTFDLWNAISLNDYNRATTHEFGLRESSFDLTAPSGATPTPNPQQRNQPGVPDYAIREISRAYPIRDGRTYWAKIFWRITLFHYNQKHLGPGITVRERIEFKDPVGFTAKPDLGHHVTDENGSVEDHYFIPFDRPDGQVTVIQTTFAGGREGTWEVIVHATPPRGEDSILEASGQYAPFH
jgi:RHS repeat-associated protein